MAAPAATAVRRRHAAHRAASGWSDEPRAGSMQWASPMRCAPEHPGDSGLERRPEMPVEGGIEQGIPQRPARNGGWSTRTLRRARDDRAFAHCARIPVPIRHAARKRLQWRRIASGCCPRYRCRSAFPRRLQCNLPPACFLDSVQLSAGFRLRDFIFIFRGTQQCQKFRPAP